MNKFIIAFFLAANLFAFTSYAPRWYVWTLHGNPPHVGLGKRGENGRYDPAFKSWFLGKQY